VDGAHASTLGPVGPHAYVALFDGRKQMELQIAGCMPTNATADDVLVYDPGHVPSIARSLRTRQRARCVAGPNRVSGRAACCRPHRRSSEQVTRHGYRVHVGGSRFLEVDPAEGGSCNDYDYVCPDSVYADAMTSIA
jgi:hypothetical protein